jgi:hypothetical protein
MYSALMRDGVREHLLLRLCSWGIVRGPGEANPGSPQRALKLTVTALQTRPVPI